MPHRFLLYGVDGLRGDVAEHNNFPDPTHGWIGSHRGRTHSGSLFHWVGALPRIGSTLATVPGWTSVLTGKEPRQHCMLSGNARHAPRRRNTPYQSFLRVAKSQGFVTAVIGSHGVTALPDGSDQNSTAVDCESAVHVQHGNNANTVNATHRWYIDGETPGDIDAGAEDRLLTFINDPAVDVIFCVFKGQDAMGHKHGPSSTEYHEYVQDVQTPRLARVMEALAASGDEWTVVLTSDHGSHDRSGLCWGAFGGTHTCWPGDWSVPFFVRFVNMGNQTPTYASDLKSNHKNAFKAAMYWYHSVLAEREKKKGCNTSLNGK